MKWLCLLVLLSACGEGLPCGVKAADSSKQSWIELWEPIIWRYLSPIYDQQACTLLEGVTVQFTDGKLVLPDGTHARAWTTRHQAAITIESYDPEPHFCLAHELAHWADWKYREEWGHSKWLHRGTFGALEEFRKDYPHGRP